MSIKQFISKLLKKDGSNRLQQETERLQEELRLLEKTERELIDNYLKN